MDMKKNYSEQFKKQMKEAFPDLVVDEQPEVTKADLLIEDPKDKDAEETFKALGVKLNLETLETKE